MSSDKFKLAYFSFLFWTHQKHFWKESKKLIKCSRYNIYCLEGHSWLRKSSESDLGGISAFPPPTHTHTGEDTVPFIIVIHNYINFIHVFELICGFGLFESDRILTSGYGSYIQTMNRAKPGLQHPADTERTRDLPLYHLSRCSTPLLEISLP